MDTAPAPTLVEAYVQHCPAREVLSVLADKWVLLVLGVLRAHDGPVRFNELRRHLDGVTQKMLTRTLRNLEREGLVHRAVYPTVPPKVEYSLTDMGESIGEISHMMGVWAVQHQDRIVAARAAFDSRPEPEALTN
ncbi:HxlR family transcriptional regulator [Nocardia tenerifensis]|uniref:HxlR family transcriptional regulator n=1 Tax=Nocardia tenerifensis TaxID=228006 RepID=A0A318JU61_9NOCA|nr:helix-turn-helix domain-containing protein [Nocardia tenerifensis]PXX59192.1 HxlR family transcriptional regulator [Nocardia tenerifensis]